MFWYSPSFSRPPALIARSAPLPQDKAGDLISLTMIGMAIGSVLQVRRHGRIGSGLLVIPSAQSAYVPGCLMAARLGGLPTMAALLLMVALFEVTLSRFLRRLRGLLPVELAGLIVLVTGLSLAQAGMDEVVGSVAERSGTAGDAGA